MKSVNYVRKLLGVSAQTVRCYIKSGKLKATQRANGRFFVEETEINRFVNELNCLSQTQVWCYYLRSSEGNKVLLNNQEKNLSEHFPAATFVIKDSASGLNENRAGLKKLIKLVKEGKITDIAVTQSDRLSRFGNSYLIELFNAYNVKLHVLFQDDKDDLQHELLWDFMSLIASFSGRFYRLRSISNKIKLLDEAKQCLEQSKSKSQTNN